MATCRVLGAVDEPANMCRKLTPEPLNKQSLFVALANAQAAECPQATKMEVGEGASIAKITVGENLGQQLSDERVQLDNCHTGSLLGEEFCYH